MKAWLLFIACVLPILAGATALTMAVTRAEHAASVRDRDRLALWRLDAAVLPVVAAEAGRAVGDFSPFRATTSYNKLYQNSETLVPSPLLGLPQSPIWLHVELGADGVLRSPQVPDGNARDVAEGQHGMGPSIAAAEGRLRACADLAEGLRALAKPGAAAPPARTFAPAPSVTWPQAQEQIAAKDEATQKVLGKSRTPSAPSEAPPQAAQSSYDVQSRFAQAQKFAYTSQTPTLTTGTTPVTVITSSLSAHWIAGHLVLVRSVGDGTVVQAAVCDWAVWRTDLLIGIRDLIPDADLRPGADDPLERRMAALPVTLVAGADAGHLPAATLAVLALAWAGVGIGILAAAAVLAAARALSERRAAFVSAVTHELRTPLTALRLHADLLHADPAAAGERAPVIRAAATRLAHLIDNVLDYARIERRAPPPLRDLPLAELLDPLLPQLAERLAAADLDLVIGERCDVEVRCDPAAVGRILINLADNAAKYAAGGGTVGLSVILLGRQVEIRLRDHGPGLDAATRRRLFRPFHRSAEAAAGNAPGVGLGLALGRRLARAMGGDLRLDSPADGTGLVVSLALVRV